MLIATGKSQSEEKLHWEGYIELMPLTSLVGLQKSLYERIKVEEEKLRKHKRIVKRSAVNEME